MENASLFYKKRICLALIFPQSYATMKMAWITSMKDPFMHMVDILPSYIFSINPISKATRRQQNNHAAKPHTRSMNPFYAIL